MQRIKISRSLEGGKYVMLLVALAAIIPLFFFWNDTHTVIACSVFLALSAILYYLFNKARIVAFDDLNMFVSNKTETEVVPLINIFKIKLTMTQLADANFWKINYIDSNGKRTAVRILPNRNAFEM